MANFTTNFNLKKPLGTEVYNIEDDNGNMDLLDTALTNKAPLASPAFTGTVSGITKSMVGLTNVPDLSFSGTNTGDQTLAGLDGASLFVTEVSVTASRTLILTDKDSKLIACNHASVAIVNTIPPNSSVAFPIGSQFAFSRDGVADVSVALGADVTITNTAKLKIANQGESMVLLKTGTDTYKLFGSLKA